MTIREMDITTLWIRSVVENCHEAAHDCIAYDNNRTNDHGNMVVSAKKAGKQCSDSFESGCRIRNKENKDDNGRNAHQDILIVLKTTGKRNRE